MILLGFWHCYFKSVCLRFPSRALGQLRVICTSPGCKSQHCGLVEDDQQILPEEPVSPVRQSTWLPASSHCYFERVQGEITCLATDALAYNEERRPRRESDFPPVIQEARGRRSRCSLPVQRISRCPDVLLHSLSVAEKASMLTNLPSVTNIASFFVSLLIQQTQVQ